MSLNIDFVLRQYGIVDGICYLGLSDSHGIEAYSISNLLTFLEKPRLYLL